MTYSYPRTLAELEARLADDLLALNLPARAWTKPRQVDGRDVLDVAVIGAGINGLSALAVLKNHGLHRTRAFDRSPPGREGPWVTSARMLTLRTPKELPGLALGLPSLTFRAWYEAQFGRETFEAMSLIPTRQWMDYLVWYRRVLKLDIVNDAHVTAVTHRPDGIFEISYASPSGTVSELARRVVIATGLDGLGEPTLPPVAGRISKKYRAHGAEIIDGPSLRGKRVAVVGSGSSAMDNAATALEAGAERVDLYIRRDSLLSVDRLGGIAGFGTRFGFSQLPDADRWEIMDAASRSSTPPPRHSVLRVSAFNNAHFHLSSPVIDLVEGTDSVTVVTPKGRYEADFVIFATGFGIAYDKRPEFASITSRAKLWGEAYSPPPERINPSLAATPYLGDSFEFLPKPGHPGAEWVSKVHCFCFPSLTSHGKINSGIPSINEGAQVLAIGVVRSLFVEDRASLLTQFHAYADSELKGDEWLDADREKSVSP